MLTTKYDSEHRIRKQLFSLLFPGPSIIIQLGSNLHWGHGDHVKKQDVPQDGGVLNLWPTWVDRATAWKWMGHAIGGFVKFRFHTKCPTAKTRLSAIHLLSISK